MHKNTGNPVFWWWLQFE